MKIFNFYEDNKIQIKKLEIFFIFLLLAMAFRAFFFLSFEHRNFNYYENLDNLLDINKFLNQIAETRVRRQTLNRNLSVVKESFSNGIIKSIN